MVIAAASSNPNRIRMESIRRLTLYADALTKGRRSKPIPQLTCEGEACEWARPDVVFCKSIGGGDWKCEADLPTSVRLGRVEVSCEGWDHSEDPFVLKDSCALTYRLLPAYHSASKHHTTSHGQDKVSLLDTLFPYLFWGVVIYIVLRFVQSLTQSTAGAGGPRRLGWLGGGGPGFGGGPGGGGGGGGDAPPPYKPDPSATFSAGGGVPNGAAWRPGFWTGLGLGGLANAAWNAFNAPPRPTATFEARYADPRNAWDEDRFATGFGRREDGRRRGNSSTRDQRASGSSERYTSTGFGGTRNR
ncbi:UNCHARACTERIZED [Ceraceosorus bombacis]|uniref:Store-operated calcium entry-associated regulatory factor n=1 Tax=Ceraceosorus bombacis TaxID=401625 RepID=A0A0P1BC04_9BASI|nr:UNCHARACTERIZED [Ceraceosorus bombacis]